VRVSLQLMQDSAFDLEEFLADIFADRLGRALQDHITNGDGTTQPEGILTAIPAAQTVVGATGQTTSVTYDDLVTLIHSVDPAYRSSPRAAFMMHDTTLAALRRLKDNSGRPLWQDGLQAGEPPRLLGFRVIVNNTMPQMSASAKSIVFGDFSKYILREVGQGLVVRRLDERYAEYLQTALLGFARYDGRVLQPAAFAVYQNSAT
ncbi:MAG: phage major capsid protein, partial [Rhodothermus sp.]|nr:phage major capsid protein [Rhodothermus sp.]